MVKDYFTALYVAEILDLDEEDAREKLEKNAFSWVEFSTLENASNIPMELLTRAEAE